MKRTRNKVKIDSVQWNALDVPVVLSMYLLDKLFKMGSDCQSLFTFYYYTARWQATNQPKCTTMYVAKGLNWGEHRVRKAKKLLIEQNLIKDVQVRNATGIAGHYIKLRFIWSQEKIEPSMLEKPTLTKTYSVDSKPTLTKTYRVGSSKGNTLSNNSLNTLSNNNKKIIIKKVLPFCSFKEQLPNNFLENETFIESLNDFIEHRQNIKIPLTDIAIKKLCNKFLRFTPDEVIEALDATVESGKWSGIYPKSKNSFKTTGKNSYKEPNKTYRKSDVTI